MNRRHATSGNLTVRVLFLGFVLAMGMLAALIPAHALQPDEILADAELERRARALSLELRCLVCQNQSIDDSDAPLARDLRVLVRERLQEGDSDAEVRAYVVARYGDFVLLRPPFDTRTLILWIAPILVLLGAVAAAMRTFARRPTEAEAREGLSAEERRRLDAILKDGDTGNPKADTSQSAKPSDSSPAAG